MYFEDTSLVFEVFWVPLARKYNAFVKALNYGVLHCQIYHSCRVYLFSFGASFQFVLVLICTN